MATFPPGRYDSGTMTLRGTIENGRLVLEDGGALPNGTRVSVSVQAATKKKTTKSDPLGRLGRHAVSTGIRDLADEHDHYAYGSPKKSAKKAKRARASSARRGRGA